MDANRFDRLVEWFAAPETRRNAARLFTALPFSGGLAAILSETSAAARRRGKRKNKGKKRKQRCTRAAQAPKRGRPCCRELIRNDAGRCARPVACDVCPNGCQFTSVQAAIDARTPGSTITICPGIYVGTVTIAKDLTLIGAGDGGDPARNSILQGDGSGRVVDISELAAAVTLQSLRITGGSTTEPGGGLRNRAAVLAMTGCTVTGNSASNAAGISNSGKMTLANCMVSANTVSVAGGNGGGITNSGDLTLTNCAVTGNSTAGDGGGIVSGLSAAILTLVSSSVTGNHADNNGGGIINFGTWSCSGDSAVSGNTEGDPPVTSNCEDAGIGEGCATCTL